MPAFHPRLEDLPAEFPVFPLPGALLLPEGKLPLNIFEPRYLAMTEAALAHGRMFGMIQPNQALPAGRTGPALYQVGCLGRISSFGETDDGCYLITLTGVIRFTATRELGMERGFRRVCGDFSPYARDLRLEEAEAGAGFDRAALCGALRRYFERRGFDANWEAIRGLSDDMLVVTLCMACPFEAEEKQALLEAPTLAARAAALHTLLQIGTHAAPDDATGRRAS